MLPPGLAEGKGGVSIRRWGTLLGLDLALVSEGRVEVGTGAVLHFTLGALPLRQRPRTAVCPRALDACGLPQQVRGGACLGDRRPGCGIRGRKRALLEDGVPSDIA